MCFIWMNVCNFTYQLLCYVFFIIIATGFFGTAGAIVAAVVMVVVGVGFVLWLRRLIAAGKASGQWNAADDA